MRKGAGRRDRNVQDGLKDDDLGKDKTDQGLYTGCYGGVSALI